MADDTSITNPGGNGSGGGGTSTGYGSNPMMLQILAQLMQGIGQGNQYTGLLGGAMGTRNYDIQKATSSQPYIGLVDVSTPIMQAYEAAGMYPALQSLLNPTWMANQLSGMAGAVPSRAAGDAGLASAAGTQGAGNLLQALFGGSIGMDQNPWTPPARPNGGGGTQLPPQLPPGLPPTGGTGTPPTGGAGTTPPTGGTQPPPAGAGGTVVPGTPDNNYGGSYGIPNYNAQGQVDPAGTFNAFGLPLNWNGGGIDPSILLASLLRQESALAPGSTPINWEAYGFSSDPGHAQTGAVDFNTYTQQPPATEAPAVGPAGTGSTNNANVTAPMFVGPRTGTGETWESWWQGLAPQYDPWKQQNAGAYGMPVDAKAAGGPLDPSALTVVGERGPEVIAPTAQGQQVIPINQQLMQLLLGAGAQGMAEGGILDQPLLDTQPQAEFLGANNMIPSTANSLSSNPGQFSGANQPAGGAIGQTLSFNPELDAFNATKDALGLGWGQQGNTAFNLGQGLLGGTGDLMQQSRQIGTGSFLTPELQQSLTGQLTSNPGQGVVDALRPVFEQNLQGAFGQLRSSSPSIFNSAQQLQGTDLARQSLNDFNLTAAQALMQGVGQQQNAASILGQLLGQNRGYQLQGLGQAGALGQGAAQTLGGLGQGAASGDLSALQTLLGGAGQAGAGQFGRMMQAGQLGQQQQQAGEQSRQFNLQYDLAAQNQAHQQAMTPTLQLLLAAMGLAEPTGLQTVVGSQKA